MKERTDLQAELFAAAGRVKQRHLDHLRGLGVAPSTIANLGQGQVSFGIVDAMPEAGGLYQPGEGAAHICQPVTSGGVLVDLVIWRAARPDRWWLRVGNGWALNGDDLDAIFRWGGPPPLLHLTPLDWLRAGGDGSVILDWDAPELPRLRLHSAIECAAPALRGELHKALVASIRLPSLSVAKGLAYA